MSNQETVTTLEEELKREGVFAYVTSGGSMEPLFRTHRDVVVIGRATGELRPLDVALYLSGEEGKYILHRVIRVREDCYVIRGDNTYQNEYVPKEAVLGVLTEFTRKGKRHSVRDLGYRIYSRTWTLIYPIRRLLRAMRRALGRAFRLVFPKRK